jgi:hypothetical protein
VWDWFANSDVASEYKLDGYAVLGVMTFKEPVDPTTQSFFFGNYFEGDEDGMLAVWD